MYFFTSGLIQAANVLQYSEGNEINQKSENVEILDLPDFLFKHY